jgi:hypothetical protein
MCVDAAFARVYAENEKCIERDNDAAVARVNAENERAGRLGWLGSLVAVSMVCGTVRCAPRPELSDFEMLHIVTGDTGAQPAAHGRHAVREAQWDAIDAQLLAASPAKPQMLASGGNWI